MLSSTTFREIVSKRRHGVAPSLLRGVLRAAEVPYSLAVCWRNRRYDRGDAVVRRVSVPVISVGNVTLGGTGKTPMVKWLTQCVAARGIRVAIVSRGYRANENGRNDEAAELERSLPGVPHVQDPDRVAGAQRAIDRFGCQLIVLDDGFQHRRLARDLDIVLLDALEPFGHEHVFPRGTLREPIIGLQRAHAVCLTRAAAIAAHEREAIRQRVSRLAPHAAWCEAAHGPTKLLSASGGSQPLALLSGKRVAAFCGIGNPAGFRHTLASSGAQIVAWREYPDHHAFTAADAKELENIMMRCNAELAVCTHKDLVKLRQDEVAERPLWAVEIEMQFLAGQEALEALVAGTGHPVAGLSGCRVGVPSAFAS
jgi:tetraacyldisaccharide 4'-kinase